MVVGRLRSPSRAEFMLHVEVFAVLVKLKAMKVKPAFDLIIKQLENSDTR